MAAVDLYFLNTGNTTFTVGNNWSLTNGGAPYGTAPTSVDNIFFTSISGPCAVAGTRLVNNMTCTGYPNNIAIANGGVLQPLGNIVLNSVMSISVTGTGLFRQGATGTACSYTGGGITLPNFNANAIGSSGSINITDTLTVVNFSVSNGNPACTLTGGDIIVLGNAAINGTETSTTGHIKLTGTGTFTWAGARAIRNNLTITSTGNYTASGTIAFGAVGVTYTIAAAATFNGSAATLTFSVGNYDFNGHLWGSSTFTNNTNANLLSTLRITTVSQGNANTDFTGTGGWDVDNFTFTSTTLGIKVMTLQQGSTYRIRNSLTISSTLGGCGFGSSSATLRANLNLDNGCMQTTSDQINATRIDSSGGTTVYVPQSATLTNTVNWNKRNSGGFFFMT